MSYRLECQRRGHRGLALDAAPARANVPLVDSQGKGNHTRHWVGRMGMERRDVRSRRSMDQWFRHSHLPECDRSSFADAPAPDDAFVFGSFRLLAIQRRLERNGSTISLGAEAFELLKTLVERAGMSSKRRSCYVVFGRTALSPRET